MAAQQALVPPGVDPAEVKDRLVSRIRVDTEANGALPLRQDPKAWRAFLRTLGHYDPNYPYNPEYEYGPDWTDDPRYVAEGVRRLMDPQHRSAIFSFWLTLKRVWGDLVQLERKILIPQAIRDGLSADNLYRVKMEGVIPDGLIAARSLPADQRSRTVRRHDPEHPDQLYLEVVSKTERDVQRDTRHKMEAYQALSIREYLLYDPFRRLGDRPRLYLYRLVGNGIPAYTKVDPARWTDGHPVYRSTVLEREIRMLPANDRDGSLEPLDNEHRLQLWEPARGVWWDPEVDVQLNLAASRAEGHAEGHAEGRVEGRVEGQIDDRRDLLAEMPVAPEESVVEILDTLERNWRRTGMVPSMAETVAVAAGRRPWHVLLTG